jgi:hypothetical protein
VTEAPAAPGEQGTPSTTVLVDAANVIGSRPNGWWRDRPGAARTFVDLVRAATAGGRLPGPVVVVLEGAARGGGVDKSSAGGVTVLHAPGSGDELMVSLIGSDDDPVTLVTADRELRRRAGAAGAASVGPSWLLERLG